MTEPWDKKWLVDSGVKRGRLSAEQAYANTVKMLAKAQDDAMRTHGRGPSRAFCATHGLDGVQAEELERIVAERLVPGPGTRLSIKRERDPHHGYPWWSVTVTIRSVEPA